MIARLTWATIPRSRKYRSSYLPRKILMRPRVVPRSLKARFNLERPISLTRSTILLCARAFDGDWVDPSPRDRCLSIDAIASNAQHDATCPAYKRRKALKPLRCPIGPSTSQYSNLGLVTCGPIICQPDYCSCHVGATYSFVWARVGPPRVCVAPH